MPIKVEMKPNTKKLAAQVKKLVSQVAPHANRAALNKALNQAHAQTVREIALRKGLKQGEISWDRGRRGKVQKWLATAGDEKAKLWIGRDVPVEKKVTTKKLSMITVVKRKKKRLKFTLGPPPGPFGGPFETKGMPRGTRWIRYPTPGVRRSSKGWSNNLPIRRVVPPGTDVLERVRLTPEIDDIARSSVNNHMRTTYVAALKREVESRAARTATRRRRGR